MTKAIAKTNKKAKAKGRANPNPARRSMWHAPDGNWYQLKDLPHGTTFLKMPTPEDIACAKPRDPDACAISRCATRESGGIPAKIGGTIAWIPMRDAKGKITVWRCRVTPATRRAIDEFDRTGIFPPGGFEFKGISPSNTVDCKRATEKRSRERWNNFRPGAGTQKRLSLRDASRSGQVFVVTGEVPAT